MCLLTATASAQVPATPPPAAPSAGVPTYWVLMVTGDNGALFGNPVVEGALVKASRVGEGRGPKIRVFKKKKRSTYRKSRGHRQDLVRVRIEGIELP